MRGVTLILISWTNTCRHATLFVQHTKENWQWCVEASYPASKFLHLVSWAINIISMRRHGHTCSTYPTFISRLLWSKMKTKNTLTCRPRKIENVLLNQRWKTCIINKGMCAFKGNSIAGTKRTIAACCLGV